MRFVKSMHLRREFENMKMKVSKTIDEHFGRFIEKVNQMKSFGKEVPNKKIVEKILDSLSERFNLMVAIIEEIKDISMLSV